MSNKYAHQRGLHDINNYLVFPSNKLFAFHDSRGFETGTEKELDLVANFIREKSQTSSTFSQLHVIWSAIHFPIIYCKCLTDYGVRYCIPVNETRNLVPAELAIFEQCLDPSELVFQKYAPGQLRTNLMSGSTTHCGVYKS